MPGRLVWLALTLLACGAARPAEPHERVRGSASLENKSESGIARTLAVPGFLPAILYAPPGDQPRPLLVAAHGAGGTPEWECEYWPQMTRDQFFVLCLRGKSMGALGGFYYPDHLALEAELLAAERAARAAEPRITRGDGVYAGFSQGASMGTVMLSAHGAQFPYLILIEGFELWNIPRARRFAKAGGKRVLLACGTRQCSSVAVQSARWLRAGGIEARLEDAVGAGHTAGGAVAERLAGALPWLLGDAP